jgi:NTE family protein
MQSPERDVGRRKALVVSGGGSKGAFAVGAIEYMVSARRLDFDIVSGTSTGAVIGTLVVARKFDKLRSIYSNIKTGDVLKRNKLRKILSGKVPSWYSTKPLDKFIDRELTQEIADDVIHSQKQVFLTSVCLQTGVIVYFQAGGPDGCTYDPTSEVKRIPNRARLIKAILASTNQPVLMPPLDVEPGPLAQYVDGGVQAYAPIQIAIDNGADEIYAVVMSPDPKNREPKTVRFRRIEKILVRTIDLLTEQVGECSLRVQERENKYLRFLDTLRRQPQLSQRVRALFQSRSNPGRGRRPITLHVIRPETELPTDGLKFEPKIMKQMIRLGWREARRVLGARS